ncbi:MAG: hypothetical protein ACRD2F_06070 [Terriglobales bacterium]
MNEPACTQTVPLSVIEVALAPPVRLEPEAAPVNDGALNWDGSLVREEAERL